MEKPKEIIITADITMSYTRVVNSIIAELPENYDHYDDVFELLDIAIEMDRKLRG